MVGFIGEKVSRLGCLGNRVDALAQRLGGRLCGFVERVQPVDSRVNHVDLVLDAVPIGRDEREQLFKSIRRVGKGSYLSGQRGLEERDGGSDWNKRGDG